MSAFSINPVSLIRTLSMALGLAVNGVNMHHWRTALLCRGIADELKMPREQQQKLLYAALLHDIGAASSHDERRKLLTPLQEVKMGGTIHTHAEVGYRLLQGSLCFYPLADIVRMHHDRWGGGNPSGLSGDAIPLESRIIHLADRIEVLVGRGGQRPVLSRSGEICRNIVAKSGSQFDPMLVDVFLKCSLAESFWLDMDNPNYADVFFQEMNRWGQSSFSLNEVLNIAELYASLIDQMSRFTATHSRSVSCVSVLLAEHCGFCDTGQAMMRMAGLLHDLGKLSVPNSILEKNGKLDEEEVRIVRQHTYYTYRILEQIEHFESIAEWAAFHHETLDGKGYPFKKSAAGLPLGSRLMAVADIFVALAEHRPYRQGLDKDSIHRIMYEMTNNGKIDRHIVDMLFDLYPTADNLVKATAEVSYEKGESSLSCAVV